MGKVLRNPYLWYLLFVATVTIGALLALGSKNLESEVEMIAIVAVAMIMLYLKIIGLV
jgi:hypothetical protein